MLEHCLKHGEESSMSVDDIDLSLQPLPLAVAIPSLPLHLRSLTSDALAHSLGTKHKNISVCLCMRTRMCWRKSAIAVVRWSGFVRHCV